MARGEMLLSFRVDEPANLRNQRGHFLAGAQRELRQRNAALGEMLRSQVGRHIESRIAARGRAKASSGRLLAVSTSIDNQYVDNWSVGVGRIDYLNQSTAKYWRTFEEGSAAVWRRPFIGTQLVTVRGRAEGFSRSDPSPGWTNLRTAKGRIAFKNGRPGLFVVTREIAPAYAYRSTAEQANLALHGLQSARQFLDRVFNAPVRTFSPKT